MRGNVIRNSSVLAALMILVFPVSTIAAMTAKTAKVVEKKSASPTVVWEAWYTITQKEGDVHYGYYFDRVEQQPDGLHFKNTIVKSENVGRITESVVAMSADRDPSQQHLDPTFFWYRQERAGQVVEVNGNVKDQKFLTVTTRVEGQDSASVVKKSIPKNTIFSTQFPLWVRARLKDWKKGREVSFYSILEDPRDPTFTPVPSSARFEKEVPGEKGEMLKMFRVKIAENQESTWHFGKDGVAMRIELPAMGLMIKKVDSQKTAESFLE